MNAVLANSGDGDERKKKNGLKYDISHVTPKCAQPFIDSLFDYPTQTQAPRCAQYSEIAPNGGNLLFGFEALEDAIFNWRQSNILISE